MPTPRRRAVRLTPESLAELQSALTKRWEADQKSDKLTREKRAELLGVSIPTYTRIVSGKGVDRSTLALAFKALGIPWNEDFCEYLETERQTPENTQEFQSVPGDRGPVAEQVGAKRSRRTIFGIGVIVTLLAVTSFTLKWRSPRPAPAKSALPLWDAEYQAAIKDGTDRFHRADYVGARAPLEKAIRIARANDSADAYSGATRLVGDLDAAQGRLRDAKQRYQEALTIRAAFAKDTMKPAIFEAIGDVETRLGEYENARRSLTLALKGYERFEEPVGVALVRRDLGSVAFQMQEFDEAERWFHESVKTLDGRDKPEIVMDVRGRRALLWMKRQRVADARDEFSQCLDYWTAKGHPRWIARCQLQLGLAYAELGRYREASALIEKSKGGFERVNDAAGALEAASHLKRVATRSSRPTS